MSSFRHSREHCSRSECLLRWHQDFFTHTPHRFRRDYPLNLSISVSGGKESKRDSLSSGERKGNSPAHNLLGYQAGGEILRRGKVTAAPASVPDRDLNGHVHWALNP